MTIRRLVLGLAAAGFVLVMAAGVAGYRGASNLATAQASAHNSATALQGAQSADVARAAFRGDVLAALVTQNPAERQKVVDNLGAEVT